MRGLFRRLLDLFGPDRPAATAGWTDEDFQAPAAAETHADPWDPTALPPETSAEHPHRVPDAAIEAAGPTVFKGGSDPWDPSDQTPAAPLDPAPDQWWQPPAHRLDPPRSADVISPIRLRPDIKAAILAGQTGIASRRERDRLLPAMTAWLEEHPASGTFRAMAAVMPELACADEGLALLRLKEAWEEDARLRQCRGRGESHLSWNRALTLVRASPDILDCLDQDAFDEWRQLPFAVPGYWAFLDHLLLDANKDDARRQFEGHLERATRPVHRAASHDLQLGHRALPPDDPRDAMRSRLGVETDQTVHETRLPRHSS